MRGERTVVLVAGLALAATGCNASPHRSTRAARSDVPAVAPVAASTTTSTTTAVTLPTQTAPIAPVTPPPGPATSAALFASMLPIERAIRGTTTPAPALVVMGADEQRDAAILAGHHDWLAAMPAGTADDIRRAVQVNMQADAELAAIPGPTPKSIPAWRIVGPRPPDELLGDYRAASAATGVAWNVLAAIHLVETRMGRIHGTSSAGAQGPMQFLPTTWASFGEGGDISSDREAILGAARFLRHYGAPRDTAGALFHYNPSWPYVRAVLDYASVMAAEGRAYYAYYGWQVYVTTTTGLFLLPEGYSGG